LFTVHGYGKLFGESLSDCCQIVVRVVVRGLLSERLLSEWLLSEWLLSEGFC
jgi:hypothetical protein